MFLRLDLMIFSEVFKTWQDKALSNLFGQEGWTRRAPETPTKILLWFWCLEHLYIKCSHETGQNAISGLENRLQCRLFPHPTWTQEAFICCSLCPVNHSLDFQNELFSPVPKHHQGRYCKKVLCLGVTIQYGFSAFPKGRSTFSQETPRVVMSDKTSLSSGSNKVTHWPLINCSTDSTCTDRRHNRKQQNH